MLMTNRRKQVLDKEEIVAAHFVVSLQNSNIFIGVGGGWGETILHLCETNRSAQNGEVSVPWVSPGFGLVLVTQRLRVKKIHLCLQSCKINISLHLLTR